eukprot:gene6968-9527_t
MFKWQIVRSIQLKKCFVNSSKQFHSYNVLHLTQHIELIKPTLKPPVANKLIYHEDIKVMIVGGPNERNDFHVNMGEEVFYQIQGKMNLDVMKNNNIERICINEGEVFLLPAGIPHSPQRYKDTIGMVFERRRAGDEIDGLRWYKSEPNEILYEEYFYCQDLGSQLNGIIENFRRFQLQHKNDSSNQIIYTNKNNFDSSILTTVNHLQKVNSSKITPPLLLSSLLDKKNKVTVNHVFDSDFKLKIITHSTAITESIIFPKVDHESVISKTELFLWQINGNSTITVTYSHKPKQDIFLPTGHVVVIAISEISTVTSTSNDQGTILALSSLLHPSDKKRWQM